MQSWAQAHWNPHVKMGQRGLRLSPAVRSGMGEPMAGWGWSRRIAGPVLLLGLLGWGCRAQAPGGNSLLLCAAASTTGVVEEIRDRYASQTGQAVELNFASTATLATQIRGGAEADLFLAANEDWARILTDIPGLVADRIDLLGNGLVVVLPNGNGRSLSSPRELLEASFASLAMANPDSMVPAGLYAREALAGLGLWESLRSRMVYGDNVRTALAYVGDRQRGSRDRLPNRRNGQLPGGPGPRDRSPVAPGDSLSVVAAEPWRAFRRRPRSVRVPAGRRGSHPVPEARLRAPVRNQSELALVNSGRMGRQPLSSSSGTVSMEFSAAEWSAIHNSLRVGLLVVLVSLPPGICLGYVLARHRFPGKWLVEVAVNLALVVPPVVTGYLLLQVFKPAAPVGGFLDRALGLRVAFEFPGLVVAAAVMSFPLMVRAIRLGFQSVDPNLETAARTLGAGWWRTFFTVSLPLARNGVIAGCVLAYARSLGEFGATVMLASQREGNRTIPLLIYTLKDRPDGLASIWPLVAVSLLLAAGALVASEYLERRGLRHESA